MIRYGFRVNDNHELECVFQKNKEEKILTGIEALKMFNRLGIDTIDNVFIRDTTLDKYKSSKDDIRIVDGKKGKIICINNYINTVGAAIDARKKYSIKNKIVTRLAATAVAGALGIGTLVNMFSCAGKELTEEDVNKFHKSSYEKIVDDLVAEDTIEQTQLPEGMTAVYVGDNSITKEMLADAISRLDEKENTNEIEQNVEEIEEPTLSEEEINNLVEQNNKELTGEEIVDNYNKDRVFTENQRYVSNEITERINKLMPIIEEVSEKRGISQSLLIDILSQESSGGLLQNIMQIEWGTWENEPLKVFNYRDNKWETLMLSNNPEAKADIVYTKDDLNNPAKNMDFGAGILESYIQEFQSIPKGIQAYNMGPSNVKKFINKAIIDGVISQEDANSLSSQLVFDIIGRYAAKDGSTGNSYLANVLKHDDNTDRPGLNQYYALIRDNDETVRLNLQAENLVEEPEETGKSL